MCSHVYATVIVTFPIPLLSFFLQTHTPKMTAATIAVRVRAPSKTITAENTEREISYSEDFSVGGSTVTREHSDHFVLHKNGCIACLTPLPTFIHMYMHVYAYSFV